MSDSLRPLSMASFGWLAYQWRDRTGLKWALLKDTFVMNTGLARDLFESQKDPEAWDRLQDRVLEAARDREKQMRQHSRAQKHHKWGKKLKGGKRQ